MELSYHWPEHGAADNFLYAHLHQALNPRSKSFINLTLTVLDKKQTPSRSLFWDALLGVMSLLAEKRARSATVAVTPLCLALESSRSNRDV